MAKPSQDPRLNARKHGLSDSFSTNGDLTVLPETQRARLPELREQVQTRAGQIEALQERVVRAIAVAEYAESWMQKRVDAGDEVFTLPMMARYFTACAEARRAIVELLRFAPSEGNEVSAARILERMNNESK